MTKLSVLDKGGKQKESIDLPKEIFGEKVNSRVIYQAVLKYQASLRQGNASTKERADVHGGGAKPYRQKGTGQARVGSNRSPLWKGGGVTFGPHTRDFSYTIPKKIKKCALRESIKVKVQDKTLLCIDDLKDKFTKTKEFAQILSALKLQGKILAVLDGSDDSVVRVSRNIPRFQIKRCADVNALDVMNNKTLLLTKTAFNKLIKRIG